VIVGERACYTDLVVPAEWGPKEVAPNGGLLEAVQCCLPEARTLPIATTARVGGSHGCDVEGMEGFAVLRAAARAGIPAVEVRVISNDIEEEDRGRWHFAEAFAAVHRLTPQLVEAIARCVS
jgi:futalosine hydrolase